MLRNIRLDHLSVCQSVCLLVRKVYCGKTADWIRMPFGMVSGVGRGMGVLDRGGYHRKARGSFGGEFGASDCNQWGLRCVVVQKCVQRSRCRLGGEWGHSRHSCIVLDGVHVPQGEGVDFGVIFPH